MGIFARCLLASMAVVCALAGCESEESKIKNAVVAAVGDGETSSPATKGTVCIHFDSYRGPLFSDPEDYGVRIEAGTDKDRANVVKMTAALEAAGLITVDRSRRLAEKEYAPYRLTPLGERHASERSNKKAVEKFCGGRTEFMALDDYSKPAPNAHLGKIATYAKYKVKAVQLPPWLQHEAFKSISYNVGSGVFASIGGCADAAFGIPTTSKLSLSLSQILSAPVSCGPMVLCETNKGWERCM